MAKYFVSREARGAQPKMITLIFQAPPGLADTSGVAQVLRVRSRVNRGTLKQYVATMLTTPTIGT